MVRCMWKRFYQNIRQFFDAFVGLDFAFVHENSRPHPAKVVQDYLREVKSTQARPRCSWTHLGPDRKVNQTSLRTATHFTFTATFRGSLNRLDKFGQHNAHFETCKQLLAVRAASSRLASFLRTLKESVLLNGNMFLICGKFSRIVTKLSFMHTEMLEYY